MSLSSHARKTKPVSILSRLRGQRATKAVIHLWLFLILPFSSVSHLGAVQVVTHEVYNDYFLTYETFQFEDWNQNGNWEEGELMWRHYGFQSDVDSDGVADDRETAWGTHYGNPDSDYDGITDGDEIDTLGGPNAGFSPLLWDSNSNGFSDFDEAYSYYGVDYSVHGAGSSYYDWDGDGRYNPQDSHPLNSGLQDDWDGDGYNDGETGPPVDSDGDGANDIDDSHDNDSSLWNDWNDNGYNDGDELDADGDNYWDMHDSHPNDGTLWMDWDWNGENDPTDDMDSDGRLDSNDSHPLDNALWSDWNNNGSNNDSDGDEDNVTDAEDSHPRDPAFWSDHDLDGYNQEDDSHPNHSDFWSDWDGNEVNNETDGDEDLVPNAEDTHPRNPQLWSDGDGDGRNSENDSDPSDSNIWSDWDLNGNNNDADGDEDGVPDTNDSHPRLSAFWSDFDGDNFNEADDSHPWNTALWSDFDENGVNNETDWDEDGYLNGDDYYPKDKTRWVQDGPPPPPADSDGDGYPDDVDTHPNDPNRHNDGDNNGFDDDNPNDPLQDFDGDGRLNSEDSHPTNHLLWSDTDGDGLNYEDEIITATSGEVTHFSNPDLYDTDGDGLNDGEEKFHQTNPWLVDTDSDNATDFEELSSGQVSSNPLDAHSISRRNGWGEIYLDGALRNQQDTDADGIPDLVESIYAPALNLNDARDKWYDLDGDGISNLDEYLNGTRIDGNTERFDADMDGITDIKEDLYPAILDKNDATDATMDADGDGLLNVEELKVGLNPMDPNSFDSTPAAPGLTFGHWEPELDAEGLPVPARFRFMPVGVESPDLQWYRTNMQVTWQMPLAKGDVDGDSIPDAWEHRYGLDLRKAADAAEDPESDRLTNLVEFRAGTSPLLINSFEGLNDYNKLYDPSIGPDTVQGTNGLYTSPTAPSELSPGSAYGFSFEDIKPGPGGDAQESAEFEYHYQKSIYDNFDPGRELANDGTTNWKTMDPVNGMPASGEYKSDKLPEEEPEPEEGEEPPPGPEEPAPVIYNCGCLDGSYCGCTKSIWHPVYNLNGTVTYYEETVSDCHCGVPVVENPPAEPEPDGPWQDEEVSIRITRTPAVPASNGPETHILVVEEKGSGEDWNVVERPEIVIASGETSGTYESDPPARGKTRRIRIEDNSIPDPATGTLSLQDMAGPQYRKIALNGQPMPDSKPQVKGEDGQQPEESYIDAYTMQLRHSVTDVYSSVESSLLPLSVRRDLTSEAYSNTGGLRPHERPDQPFGSGWRSNISAHIKFAGFHSATVVDEAGASSSYIRYRNTWQRSYEENASAKTRYDVLATVGPQTFKLTKKCGTVCLYESASIKQKFSSDRENGSDEIVENKYARLVSVTDRWGNTLKYEYMDDPVSQVDNYSLIPSKIYSAKQPQLKISIQQSQGRVTNIMGPDGAMTSYHYAPLHEVSTTESPGENTPVGAAPVLIGVSHGPPGSIGTGGISGGNDVYDGLPEQSVRYFYSVTAEHDLNTNTQNIPTVYTHVELSGIQAEQAEDDTGLPVKYVFGHQLDTTKKFFVIGNSGGEKTQHGLPMFVTHVRLPNGKHVTLSAENRKFSAGSNVLILENDEVATRVQGPAGGYKYVFSSPSLYRPPGDSTLSPSSQMVTFLAFLEMKITTEVDPTLPAGTPQLQKTETYRFNRPASMALESVTDMSGRTTRYYYSKLQVPVDISAQINWTEMGASAVNMTHYHQLYDDPIVEVNAMGGIKTFTYDQKYRILTSVKDARGVKTEYKVDSLGRRYEEKVSGPFAGGRITTTSYENADFPGFATKTVTDGLTADNAPATEVRMSPDAYGRVELQQVGGSVSGSFEELSRTFTVYDRAGRKRSVQDGRGLITNFDYDVRGRLKEVKHPDGSTKEMAYDARGNLVTETNENGVATFHAYDQFNRRFKTTLDLNGNGQPDGRYTTMTLPSGNETSPTYDGDLVTEVAYTDRNQIHSTTDARGKVTVNQYDNLGRLLETDDAGFKTTYHYLPDKFGGSVFDSSGFKPSGITDARGVTTATLMDDLYRTVEKRVLGIVGITTTVYDPVGNPRYVTDPLNRTTQFIYDVNGKVVETIYPDTTRTQTFYTHAGEPWKQVNELDAVTVMHYDAAGRPVRVTQPEVDGVSAVTETFYDLAGNSIKTKDALGRATITEYDRRNRAWKVSAAPLWDALTGQFSRPEVTTEFDALGQVLSQTDPLGRVSRKYYDRAGRSWKSTNALNHAVVSTFDPGGNVLTVSQKVTAANGALVDQTVTNVYDTHNRLESTRDGENILNEFAYDEAGNRLLVKDGLGQKTRFKYDPLGRLEKQTFEKDPATEDDDDTWLFVHDAVHKMSQEDPGGVITTYGYDARSRLKTLTVNGTLLRTHHYDDAGRLESVIEAQHPESSVAYTYDALNRTKTETSRGVTHTYSYDLAGNRVLAQLGTGRNIRTVVNALNIPELVIESAATVEGAEEARLTQYGYDLGGRAVLLVTANGQVTENVYDDLGRLTNRTLFRRMSDRTDSGVLAEFGWTYNQVGNVTAQHETWPGSADRPAGVRATEMTYDLASRLKTEIVLDNTDGVTATSYTYDNANNRATKTVTGGDNPGHWAYDYNQGNQLRSWSKYVTPGGRLRKSAALAYDDNGNRSSETLVNITASEGQATLTHQGITFQAVTTGQEGEDMSVSLLGSAPSQQLGADLVGGQHAVVTLATDAGIPHQLVNQGITYVTKTAHQTGQEVAVSLIAEAPDQEPAIEAVGNDIRVILETNNGAKAEATNQGIRYEAVTPGLTGNDLRITLEKAEPGEGLSTSVDGQEILVKLAVDEGTPDSLVNQGITYTAKRPHEAGREVAVTLDAGAANQEEGVEVNGDDIHVKLATSKGAKATGSLQGLNFEAVEPGPEGNGLAVVFEKAAPGEDLHAHVNTSNVIVALKTDDGTQAQLQLPGITYTAKDPGLAGNDITVTQTVNEVGDPLVVSQDGQAISVGLARSVGDAAIGTWAGVNFTAAEAGSAGNDITLEVRVGEEPGQALQTTISGQHILVKVAMDTESPPNPVSTVAQVVGEIQVLASALVTVSGDTGNASPVTASQSIQLTGGGENYTTSTAADVAADVLFYHPDIAALVEISTGSEGLVVGTGGLAGGVEPAVESTATQVATLLGSDEAIGDLLTVTGAGSTELEVDSVQLSGGGEGYTVLSEAGTLVTRLQASAAVSALMEVEGTGTASLQALSRTALGGGMETAVQTTVTDLVTELNADMTINGLVSLSGGSTDLLQPGVVQLQGGGSDFEVTSSADEVVTLLANHPLVTVEGSGETDLEALPRTALNGGRGPAVVSTANQLVDLLDDHPTISSLITVTGEGTEALSPLGQTYLSGVTSSTSQQTDYGWNSENRLTSVTQGEGKSYHYAYDYRVRRVATQSTENGQEKHTAILFSGGLSLSEYESSTKLTQISTPQAGVVQYVRGPDMGGGVGGLLYTVRSESGGGKKIRYNLSNGRGDIVAQSDANAALTWTASYEAYGKRTKETGVNEDKQRANSKDEDPTGLLNEGFRYRDIETGVWLSRDPAGFVDGPNLYAYVKQNPWSGWDPHGLWFRDYLSEVGEVWKGYGDAAVGMAKGIGQVIAHPIDTATNVGKAVMSPVKTAKAIANQYGDKWNSGARGQGEIIGEVLLSVATGGATKAAASSGTVAKIVDKVGDLSEVAGNAANMARRMAGGNAPDAPQVPTIACFTAGTLVASGDGPLKIEMLQVGDRVLTTDDENQRHETEVDPETWKKVTLAMINEECRWDVLELEVIRSPEWLQQMECHEGGRIWFVLDEIGLEGWADVKHIAPCPTVKPGLGRVVLSTLTHYNGDVYELRLTGSSDALEPTGRHRLFSVTRNDWVRTETLSEGEQLKTRDGVRTIASIGHHFGIHRVYNIEVETEHCYYVGPQQVLSHNQNGCAVIGTPQRTGIGHDQASLRVGTQAAADGAEKVFYNKALSTVTNGAVDSQLRPDVSIVEKGKINVVEIPSASQTVQQMQNKINRMDELLGEMSGGKSRVEQIQPGDKK